MDTCQAWEGAAAEGREFDPAECGAHRPEVLPANHLALECYEAAYWQFSNNGMGDATFPGQYVQTMLADKGVTGPSRLDVMERLRILDEQRRALDRDENGNSIRGKRKKKEPAE